MFSIHESNSTFSQKKKVQSCRIVVVSKHIQTVKIRLKRSNNYVLVFEGYRKAWHVQIPSGSQALKSLQTFVVYYQKPLMMVEINRYLITVTLFSESAIHITTV